MTEPLVISSHWKRYNQFIKKVAGWAFEQAGLDNDGLEKLIDNSDEFRERFVAAVRELSISNQFANEEVASGISYPPAYRPKGVAEQISRLQELFPGIGDADQKVAEQRLPPNAEAWFAIPRWEQVAKTYCEAVEKVLTLLSETRNGKFCNHLPGLLSPQYLRQHPKAVKALRKLGDQQKGYNTLIVPAQFGFLHRGRSVRRVREVMKSGEFGLGTFAVGIMLLTHPERLMHKGYLWIDCPGDEFDEIDSFGKSGGFSDVLCFNINDEDGDLELGAFSCDSVDDFCSSASAFIGP